MGGRGSSSGITQTYKQGDVISNNEYDKIAKEYPNAKLVYSYSVKKDDLSNTQIGASIFSSKQLGYTGEYVYTYAKKQSSDTWDVLVMKRGREIGTQVADKKQNKIVKKETVEETDLLKHLKKMKYTDTEKFFDRYW